MMNTSFPDMVYLIAFILTVLWILVSIAKKMEVNTIVHRNTIGCWLLLFIGLAVSTYYFNKLYYALPVIVLLFVAHELLWYVWHVDIFKDEGETTENCYNWMNMYCKEIVNKELTVGTATSETSSDLSEGLFDNKWNISNIEAYEKKFGTYFEYLKLEPGMKILDIGCGNGHWLQYCKSRGVDGMGITISNPQATYRVKKTD